MATTKRIGTALGAALLAGCALGPLAAAETGPAERGARRAASDAAAAPSARAADEASRADELFTLGCLVCVSAALVWFARPARGRRERRGALREERC